MQLPHRIWLGAILVPLLIAGTVVVLRAGERPAHSEQRRDGQVVFVVRGDEVVLAGTATDDEHLLVVDAVRFRAPRLRITDVIRPGASLPVAASHVGTFVGTVLDNGVHDFTGVVHEGRLTASARVADAARAGMLSDALRAVAGALRVDEDFTVGPGPTGDLDVRALNDSVQRMIGDGITFQPWDPALAERVGRLLRVAPRATVTLVAHAPQLDVAKARAAQVRDVLVAQGVSPALVETTVDVEPADATDQVDVLVR
ncbi:hypothetical protein Lesp02_55170 [Lentzea sp. NBRC 105346]|uniref:hypothetical protein n=1 Tax=Lentzea sp. NBRC 105346 TaxID=3032205 RepID=UPI0024A5CEF6|nr:hypothetical protein [Lentzea sp. NBRC 105346]GLZ33329.1 hypothetical protein Lesp02_55170 [Lentzea sp. NBRC 105346]